MSQLRSLAHLEEQLGPARFGVLMNPRYTGRFKKFCDQLVDESAVLVLKDRTYDLVCPVCEGEDSIGGATFAARAKTMSADVDKPALDHLLKHFSLSDIPEILRGQVRIVFTESPYWRDDQAITCLEWSDEDDTWLLHGCRLNDPGIKLTRHDRILRRRPDPAPKA